MVKQRGRKKAWKHQINNLIDSTGCNRTVTQYMLPVETENTTLKGTM